MNIAIDARWIFKDISGIGNYTRQILREFSKIAGKHQCTVIFSDPFLAERTSQETGICEAKHMKSVLIPWELFSIQSQLHLPRLLKKWNIQVFHSPNYMIPFAAFRRNGQGPIHAVTTIHDLIPLRFPDHAPQSRKSRFLPVFRKVLREAARRSARIATVSHVSAVDIETLLKVPMDKIDVIHNGVSPDFTPPAVPQGAFHTKRDHLQLLYVGRADPYKNIEKLIHVVHRLKTHYDCPVRLDLVGAPDPRYPEPQMCIEQFGLQEAVRWTGFVLDNELVNHIRAADVMVHASRYEGFGLQIIEAMACGIPVVCSNAGSLPEVAGNAAILVPTEDTDAYARAILHLRDHPEERKQRIAAGLQNVTRFSWEKTARETLACYEAAAPKEFV